MPKNDFSAKLGIFREKLKTIPAKLNAMPGNHAQAICRVGIMAALYVLLTMLSVRAGNLRITFASLPVLVLALLYGPMEGASAALIGEFLNQMLSYGFTATTALWLIPPAVRGLVIGVFAVQARNTGHPLENRPVPYYTVCIGAALATTLCNTAMIWADSMIYHYYSFALVFGTAALRFATGMVTAVIVATVALPLVRRLRHQVITRHS